MPLESLLELVEVLKERIESHRVALSQSEALTRSALIDPLLRELGWDTSDPTMVVPEYRSGAGRADYALIAGDRPVMMVEAKSLGTPLRDQVLAQGINYCLMEGTNHFAVTDGASWEVYETHRPVPIDEKRIAEFNLNDPSPAQACLNALALWRPSVQSGVVTVGHEPVVTSPEEASPRPQQILPADSTDSEDGLFPLLGLAREPGSEPPREIIFPDSSRVAIRYWVGVMEETVRWLIDQGFLASADCPIQRGTRNIVSTSPEHPGGQVPRFKRVNTLYFDANFNGPHLVENSRTVIRHVGQDPADFKVRFS